MGRGPLLLSLLQAPLGEAQQCSQCFSEGIILSKPTTTTSKEGMPNEHGSLLQCAVTTSVFKEVSWSKSSSGYLKCGVSRELCHKLHCCVRKKRRKINCADLFEGEILRNEPVKALLASINSFCPKPR